MPTVVVLGSNSFSGSDFIDLLLSETDHRVVGVSRSPEKHPIFLPYRTHPQRSRFQFVRLDLNREMESLTQLLEALRPEAIVNFAAQSEVAPSWEHPEQWAQTNVVSTSALAGFLAGRDWLQRYVHISTPEVYGSCSGSVSESAPFQPSTPYAASRAGAELMLQALVKRGNLPALIVRSANVYGAHQQLHKIIPRTSIYLKLGRTLELHGGGHSRRSFIHIRDVSRGELAVLRHGEIGAAYHLATDKVTAIRNLVRLVGEIAGVDTGRFVRDAGERPGHDDAYLLDCTKARTQLGWQPQIDLDQGIGEVVTWIHDNWNEIQNAPLEYVHKT